MRDILDHSFLHLTWPEAALQKELSFAMTMAFFSSLKLESSCQPSGHLVDDKLFHLSHWNSGTNLGVSPLWNGEKS